MFPAYKAALAWTHWLYFSLDDEITPERHFAGEPIAIAAMLSFDATLGLVSGASPTNTPTNTLHSRHNPLRTHPLGTEGMACKMRRRL